VQVALSSFFKNRIQESEFRTQHNKCILHDTQHRIQDAGYKTPPTAD
jgi:hypothetical protein